ncbi:hypothetical protein Pmani_012519 [Petrolisthes manimaculis]|uniref:Uncharacterized protein n=1 Tax=Petrolisthes manimaculis TaxID=1843537 RepID=A0AAE1PYV7_9EUCA|nr:hypothetical protein Pmani_012519 [Petrolisthes manimaculis]
MFVELSEEDKTVECEEDKTVECEQDKIVECEQDWSMHQYATPSLYRLGGSALCEHVYWCGAPHLYQTVILCWCDVIPLPLGVGQGGSTPYLFLSWPPLGSLRGPRGGPKGT